MKKVWIVSFLVFGVLIAGCDTQDSARSDGDSRVATGRTGTSYFFDKDLRPTVAQARPRGAKRDVAAEKPQAASAWQETSATPPQTTSAAPNQPTVPQPTTPQPELMTASVEDYTPVRTGYVEPAPSYFGTRPSYNRIGPDLVALSESGGNILSMIYPRPDYGILQVEKTMPTEVRLNTPFAYVIKVTNLTDVMLTDVVITETLSEDFALEASEPTATNNNGSLVWEIESLGPKASKSIRISGSATGSKQLAHFTAITHTIRDHAVVKVVEPTLELRKIAPSEALLCEPIPVDYVVTNTGTGAAQNVQIVDTLPTGLQTVDGRGKITLDAGTLKSGESRRFSVKIRATKTGAFTNKAVATSATGIRSESVATLTNVRQPILQITKSGPQRQYLGRPVTYEITVLNKGDGPARDTMIEDMIPPGVTGIEATSGALTSGSKLVWELGTLEPNVSKKVQVSYMPTRDGDLMATATATAYCAETVTDSAKTAITGIAAPRLAVIDLEDPVEVGHNTTYLITVTNDGSAADANVRIVCALDDKMQYVSSAGATAGSIMGKTVSFAPLRNLEPKAKATWRVVLRGARAGDARFKVTMHTDQLALPVEHTEATHIYQQ